MLRNFVIFSLCLVASHASGDFSVLSIPKAVAFKGKTAIDSEYVGDVMNSVMGNPATENAQWDGLFINDPFSLVNKAVVVVLKGIEHIKPKDAKTYQLNGGSVEGSLSGLSNILKTNNVPLCNLNFIKFNEAVNEFHSCFENIEPITPESDILKPDGDNEFLQSIGYINAAAENFMKRKSEVIFIHLTVESISKSHSDRAEAIKAASKLASEAIDKLNKAVKESNTDESFVVVITEKLADGNRRKREVITGNSQNEFNLATYYNQDYPVIFNIILWFMVTFGLSLLAICYAIGDMDPGRDSIIYRMTSTRMKKDN